MYKCPICKQLFPTNVGSKTCYAKCVANAPAPKTVSVRDLGACDAEVLTSNFRVEFHSDDDQGLHKADKGISAIITPIADVLSRAEAEQLCCDELFPGKSMRSILLAAHTSENPDAPEWKLISAIERKMAEMFQKVRVGIDPDMKFEFREVINRYDYSTFKHIIINGRECCELKIEMLDGYILK